MSGTDLERSRTISGGVNFIVDIHKEEDRTEFLKEALLLRQALSLCLQWLKNHYVWRLPFLNQLEF